MRLCNSYFTYFNWTNVCSGYLVPEYMCHRQLSNKADVFSFGVLLLETVSGKRNRGFTMPKDKVYLPTQLYPLLFQKLFFILDLVNFLLLGLQKNASIISLLIKDFNR